MEKETSKQYIVSMAPTMYETATKLAKEKGHTFAAYIRELIDRDVQKELFSTSRGDHIVHLQRNSNLLVKLHPEGFAIWKEAAERLSSTPTHLPLDYYTRQADSEGYVDFLLIHFLMIFGPVHNWASPPFDQDIRVKAEFRRT